MSAFRDMMHRDIDKVFLNLDDFADEHTWDGVKIKCVVDKDSLIKEYSSEFETLPRGSHLVYASAESFSKRPQVNAAVRFDNNIYTIDEVTDAVGMYIIYLARGRA